MQDNPAAGAPCRVRKVFIRGLKHTRESVIRSELARVERASTLVEISNGCLEAARARCSRSESLKAAMCWSIRRL